MTPLQQKIKGKVFGLHVATAVYSFQGQTGTLVAYVPPPSINIVAYKNTIKYTNSFIKKIWKKFILGGKQWQNATVNVMY